MSKTRRSRPSLSRASRVIFSTPQPPHTKIHEKETGFRPTVQCFAILAVKKTLLLYQLIRGRGHIVSTRFTLFAVAVAAAAAAAAVVVAAAAAAAVAVAVAVVVRAFGFNLHGGCVFSDQPCVFVHAQNNFVTCLLYWPP